MMGRWAQRRRSGGGGQPTVTGPPLVLLHMVSVTFVGSDGTIVYSGNVNVADFAGQEDQWIIGPVTGNLSNAVVQGAANSLVVTFDGPPDPSDNQVTWMGTVAGVETPDTISF